MNTKNKWLITDEQKNEFIDAITPELTLLRTKVGISQGELAKIIGVSRQTYGDIERGNKSLTWNVFLALVMFYDYNHKTHQFIRQIGAFPKEIVKHFNENMNFDDSKHDSVLAEELNFILNNIDEEGKHAIRTFALIEYARFTGTPGDEVVRSFDGTSFGSSDKCEDAMEMLKVIKKKRTIK